MALALLSDLLDNYRHRPKHRNLYDQHFGLSLLNDDLPTPTSLAIPESLLSFYVRPWRKLESSESGVSTVRSDKNEFRINLDVQQFKPEELNVKLADGYIVVDGRHEERSDEHGFVSRQFTRKYHIPKDVDQDTLASTLSSDGVLVLKAKKRRRPDENEKEIPITMTHEPAIKRRKPSNEEERMEQ